MEHAWCLDVARDAAVRAAEDGRDRPLPTLGECIETAFSAGVRDSFRKVGEAWAMIPKSVSASSPVDQENKGDGMRTERITLEVIGWTHGVPSSEEMSRCLKTCGLLAIDKPSYVRVIEEPAQAASGGGEGEPVAWGVMSIADPPHRVWLSWDQELAERWARQKQCDYNSQLVVVPLYRQPPQPRGWLTGEESALVKSWERHYMQGAHYAQSPSHTNDIAAEMGKLAEVCRSILARSTPPEVVLESWREAAGEVVSLDDVRAALAAIGVAVKEVGRE